jgi:hypothetical protein
MLLAFVDAAKFFISHAGGPNNIEDSWKGIWSFR